MIDVNASNLGLNNAVEWKCWLINRYARIPYPHCNDLKHNDLKHNDDYS